MDGSRQLSPLEETKILDQRETSRVWEVLTERIEAFIAAWETEEDPPMPGLFAPAEPPAVRRLTLIELLKIDLEYRHKSGINQRVEDYLPQLPELTSSGGGMPCDLIYEEYHVRRGLGEDVKPEEYFARFPQQANELRRLLGLEKPELTSTLVSSARPAEVKVGEKIDDFDLLAKLGQGAFATVFLARQNSLQRMVALKVSANSGSEPQTLAQLDHPNIVRVYDQRLLPERGLRLLYMQYVSGGTLQSAIETVMELPADERNGRAMIGAVDRALDKRGESAPFESSTRQEFAGKNWWETVCMTGQQLAKALDYSHHRGVLHRDLKPANILLSNEGVAKLVDFNISFCSKLEGASPAAYFGGSLAYMSPEQLEAVSPAHDREADSLDGRSDLYSLGVVLWEMLTGERPFADEISPTNWSKTLAGMIDSRRAGPTPQMRAKLARVCPPSVQDALLILLAPQAEDRPANGKEAAQQLRLCMNANASRLMRQEQSGWKKQVRRWPLAVLLLVIVLPNVVAAVFNFLYNEPRQRNMPVFHTIAAAVNGVAFPVGLAIVIYIANPLTQAMRRYAKKLPIDSGLAQRARETCLRYGNYAAVLGIVLWSISGLVYPMAKHFAGVGTQFGDAMHFISSLALCGLIAASYPFFGVTYLTMCVMYPALVKQATIGTEELEQMVKLHKLTWFYLAVAVAVPMFCVLLLAFLKQDDSRNSTQILCGAGLLGAGIIFRLARRVQRDLATLAEATGSRSDSIEGSTDSFHNRFL
jgi:eukaryotic-like serine/threonine-protein kinase